MSRSEPSLSSLLHRLAALIAREAPSYPPATRRRALTEVGRVRALLARPEISLRGPTMKNPFQPYDVTVDDRITRVRTFDEGQCAAALTLQGLGSLTLQKTVIKALESRLRRLVVETHGCWLSPGGHHEVANRAPPVGSGDPVATIGGLPWRATPRSSLPNA